VDGENRNLLGARRSVRFFQSAESMTHEKWP